MNFYGLFENVRECLKMCPQKIIKNLELTIKSTGIQRITIYLIFDI